MPLQIIDGKGVVDTINSYITSYKDYKIYEFQYHKTLENEHKVIYDSIKFEYLICNPRKKFGYLIKQFDESFKEKKKIDSILSKHGLITTKTDSFYVTNSILKSHDKIYDDGSKVIYRNLYEGFYDSVYLIFDKKLNNTEFSISRYEDSIHRSKLSKLMLFIRHDSKENAIPNQKDFYITSIEIKKDTAKNEEKLITLFKRFIEFDKNDSN
jgi:hypothetical protein